MVVTIDGPGGAGKTTVSRRLARELGFAHLDTGALYRSLGLAVQVAGVDPHDQAAVARVVEEADLELQPTDRGFVVLLDGRDTESFIRNDRIGQMASRVSAQAAVRRRLLDLQRQAGGQGDLVCEGRDMGTVVFPRAEAKFFLTASDQERARRRWLELSPTRPELTLEEVAAELAQRDQRDSQRELAPLTPAADAMVVDCSDLTVDQVVALMRKAVSQVQK